ncbi:PREDICTED: uncharacterized protein LOC105114494 [Populus euphratica]|uniref:Uncharacterized protein LOC105114494 n=1 Tax=Populus euphratica TaxID=75702 RepID=A0AAJ6TDT1_POPEU|nr:PREDICTED: uncharacterized protein LOC105114494 [Populus euphratica]
MKCKYKIDRIEYAVKRIKVSYHDRELILREASTHARMHHKNIVRYHQAWTENLQPKSNHDDMRGSSSAGEDTAALFIQMECCPIYFAAYASYPDVHDCVGQTGGFVDSREQRQALLHYYFVCNTTTRQCVAIPNPRPRTAPFAAAIAYDPAKSPHYKVVRFIYFEKKLLARRSIYLDGMIYKLSFVVNYLIRFDLNAPSDVAIELPHKNAAACHGFIGMSRGSLYYSNHDESGLMISIWLLEDRCKRDPFWKLTHRISMDSLTSKYPDVRNSGFHFRTYAIHPASDIIFPGNPSMVLSYDLIQQIRRGFYIV